MSLAITVRANGVRARAIGPTEAWLKLPGDSEFASKAQGRFLRPDTHEITVAGRGEPAVAAVFCFLGYAGFLVAL